MQPLEYITNHKKEFGYLFLPRPIAILVRQSGAAHVDEGVADPVPLGPDPACTATDGDRRGAAGECRSE